MAFNYKLNFYKDEEGEYSLFSQSEFFELKEIISKYWPNDRSPQDLRLILLSDNKDNRLILKQIKNGVFEVFYLDSKNNHYHKKSRIELIHQSFEHFCKAQFEELQKKLNRTTEYKKYINKEVLKTHNYKISKKRNLKQLEWLLFGLPVFVVFVLYGILALNKENISPIVIYLAPLIILGGIYALVPGLLLHWQYYNDNKNLSVQITRGNSEILVTTDKGQRLYNKSDIFKVLKVGQDKNLNFGFIVNGPPWNEYGYTQIEFKSGEVINLTNLLIDQLFILDKFEYDNLKKFKVQKTLPFLNQQTRIKTVPNSSYKQ